MKRNLLITLISAIVIMIIAPASFAQEENDEKTVKKRIKIVNVDEEGNKVIIDTTLTGDIDLDEFDLGEGISILEADESTWTIEDGNVLIMKKGDGHKYKFYSNDDNKVIDKEGVIIMKSDDGNSFSVIEIDEDDIDRMKNIHVDIDEDIIHSKDDHIIMKAGKNSNHAI